MSKIIYPCPAGHGCGDGGGGGCCGCGGICGGCCYCCCCGGGGVLDRLDVEAVVEGGVCLSNDLEYL